MPRVERAGERRLGLLIALVFALLFCLLDRSGLAQSPDAGAIEIAVVDADGRAVPDARLMLSDPATGAKTTAASNGEGRWRFAGLRAGRYQLEIVATGMDAWENRAIVEAGSVTPVEAHLVVTGQRQTVEVKGDEAPVVDTSDPAIATTLGGAAVHNLPSSNRRWSDFALLTPGVTPDADANGLLSFRGIGALLNNTMLDGTDNNDAFFSEETGRTTVAYSTSEASVAEFRVNTSNYGAEYGRAAGGVVNTVTESGTNHLHGQVFAYDRNSAWGTTNPFATSTVENPDGTYTTGTVRVRDSLLQGGAAVGGPIRRDRIFGFFTWDHYGRNYPGIARASNPSILFETPTAQQMETLAARMLVTPTQALQSYDQVLAGLASLLGAVPRSATEEILFPKLDWQMSERDHFTVQYNRMRWNAPNGVQSSPSVTYGVASFGNSVVANDIMVAKWARFLTPNLLNEMHVQYARDLETQSAGAPAPFEQAFSQNIYSHPPQVRISPYGFTFGTPPVLNRAAYPDERRQDFADTVTWIRGRRTWKVGYEYNYINDYSDSLYDANGTYDYSNVLNFASDYLAPDSCDDSSTGAGVLPCYSYYEQGVGPTTFQFQSADWALFVSDEWKVTPRVTFSLGVRYEYEQLPNTNAALVNPAIPETANLPHDKNNLGPRLGVAWDVFGSGRTVLRVGVGTYYGRIINSTAFTALTQTGVAKSQRSYYFRPTDVGTPPFPFVFSSTPVLTVAPAAAYFDPRFQNPEVHQAEVSVEQRVGGNTSITVAGLASLGRELPSYLDRNIDLSQVGSVTYLVTGATGTGPLPSRFTTKFFSARLNPNYGQITDIFSETNSKYVAGVVKADYRMSRVFDLHASFTFAHATDWNQNPTAFTDSDDVLDPTDLRLEYGNSNYDIRRRLTGGLVLQAPWHLRGGEGTLLNGWMASTTGELRDGLPYSMGTSGAIPSVEQYNEFGQLTKVEGLGASINGSGGATRIPGLGRNVYRRPAVANCNVRMTKRTALNERTSLELMVEAFNALNHENVTSVETTGYEMTGASSSSLMPKLTWQDGGTSGTGYVFGEPLNANNTSLYRDRQLQVGARLRF